MKKFFFVVILLASFNAFAQLGVGDKVPEYIFENKKGEKFALSSLKGKLVYIDVWATWCAPCRAEIPYIKYLEEQYKDKDIVFLSVSTDPNKANWEKYTTLNDMTGPYQVFAPEESSYRISLDFNIRTIPRFIVISKDGVVLNPNAPQPSHPRIMEYIDILLNL